MSQTGLPPTICPSGASRAIDVWGGGGGWLITVQEGLGRLGTEAGMCLATGFGLWG